MAASAKNAVANQVLYIILIYSGQIVWKQFATIKHFGIMLSKSWKLEKIVKLNNCQTSSTHNTRPIQKRLVPRLIARDSRATYGHVSTVIRFRSRFQRKNKSDAIFKNESFNSNEAKRFPSKLALGLKNSDIETGIMIVPKGEDVADLISSPEIVYGTQHVKSAPRSHPIVWPFFTNQFFSCQADCIAFEDRPCNMTNK
uniref:Uncharacterized protein n=1 Tax=Strigamia maritima TaxID=126957 RepID=T1IVA0_STRMM